MAASKVEAGAGAGAGTGLSRVTIDPSRTGLVESDEIVAICKREEKKK